MIRPDTVRTTPNYLEEGVLLVSAPSIMEKTFSSAKSLYKPIEPLGILYIAGNLLKNKINTAILDCNLEGLSIDESVNEIKKIKPMAMGISCLTAEAYLVEELLKRIREAVPDIKIIMGNMHASYFSDYFLSKNLSDYVVHGEGEEVMVDLVRDIKEKTNNIKNIRGVSYRNDENEIIITNEKNNVSDLDSLPFPAWNIIEPNKYRHSFYYNFNPSRTRMMITSRGCPIGCSFCVIHEGQKVRHHSPERVIDELEFLIKDYRTTHINFLDAMFLSKSSRTIKLCEMIISRNIKIKWACEAHVNFINPEILRLMKRAGCETIYFGIESGDDNLLKNIGKKSNTEQIRKAITMTAQVGIKSVGFFMLGLPGETEELTKKTILFSVSLPLDMAIYSITVPYPGSQLFEDVKKRDDKFDQYDWDGFCNTGFLGKNPPIWSPDELPYEKLKKLQAKAMKQFHFSPKTIYRHIKSLRYATAEDIGALFNVARLVIKNAL